MTDLKTTSGLAGIALALSTFAGTGHAQHAAKDADGLPYNQVERVGSIEYLTGGIGSEAEERLHAFAKAHGYNMQLLFTLNAGNYVTDVDVEVKNERGETVVRDVADGPYFLAKVPPGSYSVTATYEGESETRKISVGDRGMRVAHFRWPADPATDFTFARSGAATRGTSGS